jgi:Cu/Ag efflux protein CusF
MKKVLSLALALVFCAAVGLAHGKGGGMEATITKVDMAAKSMVVKAADGKDMTIYWNDDTKVTGTIKEGETIHFRSSEKDGKIWATSVHVGKVKKTT